MPDGSVFINEPMKKHTTFRIGGPADILVKPSDIEQIKKLCGECQKQNAPYVVLGNGSNVLVADEGIRGVVILLLDNYARIRVEGDIITAQAGARLSKIGSAALSKSLSGFEFACGIPGTLGGACIMNAGAYGGEMKDVLESATFFDEQLREVTLSASDLHLGYRTSAFELMPWCILRASFLLTPGDSEEIRARMRDFAQRRVDKQPLDMPSAGSTFKRPKGAYAGALIDKCGLLLCGGV